MNINTDNPDDEPTEEELEKHEFEDYLNDKAHQFNDLCQERHENEIDFLEGDVLQNLLNTLADTSNYCRKQAVKLLILQDNLSDQLGTNLGKKTGDDIQIGAQSFRKGMK